MTEDEQTVLIVFASVSGALLIGLLLFYAAFQRLPHWLRNLCNAPPVFSCQAADQKVASYNQVVTGRVLGVACAPLVIVIAMVIVVLADKSYLSSEHNALVPTVACGAEVAKEKVAMAAQIAGGDAAAAVFAAQRLRTDAACAGVWGDRSLMEEARAAVTFSDAHSRYSAAQDALYRRAISHVAGTIDDHDKQQASAFTAQMMTYEAARDCASARLADGVVNYADMVSWDAFGAKAKLLFSGLTDAAAATRAKIEAYPDGEQAARRAAILAGVAPAHPRAGSLLGAVGTSAEQAGNFSLTVDRLQSGFTSETAAYLKRVHTDHNKDVDLYVGLSASMIAMTTIAIIGCLVLVVRYRAEIRGDITIRANFEDSVESKQRLQGYVKDISGMHVEDEHVPVNDSVVDKCFATLILKLQELKPFVSHCLFEGQLEEEHENDREDALDGGRTALYPVRSEAGMHFFPSCAVMCVSTTFFDKTNDKILHAAAGDEDDEGSEDPLTCEDVADDYNNFIAIVTKAVARHGGVVHHVASGMVCCTWNVSITCTKASERAVKAAFKLQEEFQQALADDMIVTVPEDARLRISVCTGDVMAGLVRAFPQRNIMIGNTPLMAERMTEMNELHGADILMDHMTHHHVQDLFWAKPVYVMPSGGLMYEVKNKAPMGGAQTDSRSKRDGGGADERKYLKDYLECFEYLTKKGDHEKAKQSLDAHLQKVKSDRNAKEDKCAEYLKIRLQKMPAVNQQGGKVDDLPMMN
eukprot:TRINITY_DN2735_c0_g1_i1.p1 TRINITY_DN2735_c0_g1~~TRINITY_DN2735_c0_g1_i1.p1  ORF type:complete len:752 (+),score=273.61 TRINITY_DN2735_c0_g1_i1:72-2327(+)